MRVDRKCLVVALLLLSVIPVFAQQSANEQAVWKLEHQYWAYVKVNDMVSYRALWHSNFVGWPANSAQPVGKDHITDWLAVYASKGEHLKSYTLKPAASRTTGDIVVTHYWINTDWVGKDGHENRGTDRITHTWVHGANGWKIIGGMSCSRPNAGK